MRLIFSYSIVLFLSILFPECQSKKREYVSKPTRSVLNPESDLLEVEAVAYHLNDTSTSVFLRINNQNLLYKRPDTSKAFYSELRVSYRLLSEVNSKKIIDSNFFYVLDRSVDEQVQAKTIFSSFNLKARRGSSYHLDLQVTDVNRKTRYGKGLNIYKQNTRSSQNFLVRVKDSIAFKNTFLKDESISVELSDPEQREVWIDYFYKEFGPALPPFSTQAPDELRYKADSTFSVNIHSRVFNFNMPEKGFYHIKADRNEFDGITLYTVDKTFPGVGSSLEMINCTRYIMFREEFENCRDAIDKKAAIDEFWLAIGGSLERARELLKRYYGRVKEANKNYSSYTEGWKSDRGMIFIVMGAPSNIYRSKNNEIWMYGNEANPNALRFVFNKTENPFSDNDYVMERSPFYKEAYHTAVEYWRQGLIYNDNRK